MTPVPAIDVRPTVESERLDILDAMRGFALGGIFLLNLAVFSGFVFMSPETAAASPTAALDFPVAGLTIWLGLWVGRSGMLGDMTPWLPTLRRVRLWSFAVGLPAAAAHVVLMVSSTPTRPWLTVAEAAAYAFGVAPLALGYATTFVILWQSIRWRRRLARLAPAGRMALTNYLTHTLVSLAIFYGIGFGLMGRLGPAWWPLIVVAMIAAQMAFSRWWLARFAFGPVEWIWRQATYGRRLPLRRG